MAPETDAAGPERQALREFVSGDRRLEAVRSAAGGSEVWLVGGSVRDLLVGRSPTDLDLVIEGDPSAMARELDPDASIHTRFMTATLLLDGRHVDIAGARTERYPYPGSLPEVELAQIEADLARRDFTFNAIAVPLSDPGEILDPFDGLGALSEGRLTLLHEESLIDDPIRALRGARYAARFGFDPDPPMRLALENVDLASVSAERRATELRRFAGEPDPERALEIAREWGLIELDEEVIGLIGPAIELVSSTGPWKGTARPADLVGAAFDSFGQVEAFPAECPTTRIEQFDLVVRTAPEVLVLARADGREWLDWWPETGRRLRLEIDGDDLVAAGVEPGPAIGVGLRAALAEALEAGGTDRDRQLETAISAAEGTSR